MDDIEHNQKDLIIRSTLQEFINSQYKTSNLLYEGTTKNTQLYNCVHIGEQLGRELQLDIIMEGIKTNHQLKEDIFQRGVAGIKNIFKKGDEKTKLDTLFQTFKKTTDPYVSSSPSPYAPDPSKDANPFGFTSNIQNTKEGVGGLGVLFGKRFANLQKNSNLQNANLTADQVKANQSKIEQLLNKLRSKLPQGLNDVLDEIGIFARQHQYLTNFIVAGLVALTVIYGGPLALSPLLTKFVMGTGLRTIVGILKGEEPTRAATKAAAVSGVGLGIGVLFQKFGSSIFDWISSKFTPNPTPIPIPPTPTPTPTPPTPAPTPTPTPIPPTPSPTPTPVVPSPTPTPTPTVVPQGGVLPPGPPPVQGINIPSIPSVSGALVRQKLDALANLASTTDIKGGQLQTGAPQAAIKKWIDSIINADEAKAILAAPGARQQLLRKGVLGTLSKKFNIQEKLSKAEIELEYIKAELLAEAGPLNYAFGSRGPNAGAERMDYKTVQSDFLKFTDNIGKLFGLSRRDDIEKKLFNTYSDVYNYYMKVKEWLYPKGSAVKPPVTPVTPEPQPGPIPPVQPTPPGPVVPGPGTDPVKPGTGTPPDDKDIFGPEDCEKIRKIARKQVFALRLQGFVIPQGGDYTKPKLTGPDKVNVVYYIKNSTNVSARYTILMNGKPMAFRIGNKNLISKTYVDSFKGKLKEAVVNLSVESMKKEFTSHFVMALTNGIMKDPTFNPKKYKFQSQASYQVLFNKVNECIQGDDQLNSEISSMLQTHTRFISKFNDDPMNEKYKPKFIFAVTTARTFILEEEGGQITPNKPEEPPKGSNKSKSINPEPISTSEPQVKGFGIQSRGDTKGAAESITKLGNLLKNINK